ncbi:hypothetical protein DW201_02845 [Enterococcus casseliflavus]|nr:hypothetical protein DW201_02845 [Enterococcus casseliflavus]
MKFFYLIYKNATLQGFLHPPNQSFQVCPHGVDKQTFASPQFCLLFLFKNERVLRRKFHRLKQILTQLLHIFFKIS